MEKTLRRTPIASAQDALLRRLSPRGVFRPEREATVRFPVIASLVLFVHMAWTAACWISAFLYDRQGPDYYWDVLLLILLWGIGEAFLAVPVIIAAFSAVSAWWKSTYRSDLRVAVPVTVLVGTNIVALTYGVVVAWIVFSVAWFNS